MVVWILGIGDLKVDERLAIASVEIDVAAQRVVIREFNRIDGLRWLSVN